MINNPKNLCTQQTSGGNNMDSIKRTMTKFSNFGSKGAVMHNVRQPICSKCMYRHSTPSNHVELPSKQNCNQRGFISVCKTVIICVCVFTCRVMTVCIFVCAVPACLLHYFPSGCVLSSCVVQRGTIRSVSGNRVCVCSAAMATTLLPGVSSL